MSLELVLYLRAVGGRARRGVGVGARGVVGAAPRLQTQFKGDEGLEGAGWTFVEAAARRLLGGLRGASVGVRRAGAAAYRVALPRPCLLVPYKPLATSSSTKKALVGACEDQARS